MALVAIVGRPNVGKSTLFNRLTEERRAIVDDQPGVTRDRIFGSVEWTGHHFDLVDTGGLVPRSAERFDAAIREQVMLTLEEADVILFVVDTLAGISDLDAEVAVHEHERDRLEHLCRYVLRPPIPLDRIKLLADALVCVELKRAWSDGTTHVTMSPSPGVWGSSPRRQPPR